MREKRIARFRAHPFDSLTAPLQKALLSVDVVGVSYRQRIRGRVGLDNRLLTHVRELSQDAGHAVPGSGSRLQFVRARRQFSRLGAARLQRRRATDAEGSSDELRSDLSLRAHCHERHEPDSALHARQVERRGV